MACVKKMRKTALAVFECLEDHLESEPNDVVAVLGGCMSGLISFGVDLASEGHEDDAIDSLKGLFGDICDLSKKTIKMKRGPIQ